MFVVLMVLRFLPVGVCGTGAFFTMLACYILLLLYMSRLGPVCETAFVPWSTFDVACCLGFLFEIFALGCVRCEPVLTWWSAADFSLTGWACLTLSLPPGCAHTRVRLCRGKAGLPERSRAK